MSQKSDEQYRKMTETPISSLVIRLSIPTVISMLITNIYNLADTAFVGRLGNSASGAVGVIFGFMAIIQAVGFMFGQGAGSIASRALGGREDKRAANVASTAFFSALAVGVIISAGGMIFQDQLVDLLGSTETIAPYAKEYIRYILVAAPFMIGGFVLNNVLRYEGKAFLGMIGMLIGALLNIALDPILIFVLDMGIGGAGLATATSQIVSFSVLLYMFLSGRTQCRISFRDMEFSWINVGDICATGLPSMLRQGLASITTVLLNSEVGVYGDEAVAAMSIVSRVSMLMVSCSLGIGQGFQPVCAYNYGAGKYKRVRNAFKFTTILSELIIGIASICVLILSSNVIGLFRDDAQVIEIGTRALRLQCLAMFLVPCCMVTEMLLQSTGKRVAASALSSMKNGVIFLPLLIILAHVRGLSGIQEAQPLAYVVTFVPSLVFAVYFFRRLPTEEVQLSQEC